MKQKMPITAKNDVFKMVKEGYKNQEIIEKIKTDYGVDISQTYVSLKRKEMFVQDMTYATRDVERKMKKKLNIDANMLEIAEEFTEIGKKWLKENRDREFSPKEISMVMSAFHKLFNSFQEASGGTRRVENIASKIKALDIKAEEGE